MPTRSSVLSTCKRTYIVIVLISVLSVAVNTPKIYDAYKAPTVVDPCTGNYRYEKIARENNSTYSSSHKSKTLYKPITLFFSAAIDYLLPVIITTILNTLTVRLLRARRRMGSERSRNTQRSQADLRLTKMIIAVNVVFMVCLLPEIIVRISRYFISSRKLLKTLPIVQIFLMINVAANVVVYCMFNKHLFSALRSFCRKCFKCVKERETHRNTETTKTGSV